MGLTGGDERVLEDLVRDCVDLLQGSALLRHLKPKIIFDWRSVDSLAPNMISKWSRREDCPLDRLPFWLRLEIVTVPEIWGVQAVEGWMDLFCRNEEVRGRLTVTTDQRNVEWVEYDYC